MKVLWLTSWYPNKITPENGDFVQRHARALSLFCNVDVIHVEKDSLQILNQSIEISKNKNGNLTENIILFSPVKIPVIGKYLSFLKYKKLFKQAVLQYIKESGLPDLVHVHIAMKAGVIALWVKKKFDVPFTITEHWTIYNSTAVDAYEKRGIIFKNYTKKIFQNASLHISVSKNLAETIGRKISNLPFKIVYNTVNTSHFFYTHSKNADFTFVHASSLGEQKNPEIIIDAFTCFIQDNPSAKLLLIGEAPANLKKYADQKKLPPGSINFTGFIPYEKLGTIVQQCHVFVLFSRRENMPCVVAEALCCGLPVITSNAGGTAEVINDNNGIVVYNYSKQALTSAMARVYSTYNQYNPEKISEEAISVFKYEAIGQKIMDAYQTVFKDT